MSGLLNGGRGHLPDGQQRPAPYERLRDAIVSGALEPGAQLVESALAEWCGVSRTPVREALSRLEQDGLVRRGERGLVVRERSPEEILDIYEVRIVLEATAARVAAARRTQLDLVRIERLMTALTEVDTSDPAEMARRNREFHKGVWAASHNESLVDLLGRLNMHLIRYPATTLSYKDRWAEALGEHKRLVAAIVAGDATEAGNIAEAHFSRARDIRLRVWELEEGPL
ncbi:GntR family transcriptional regulator [Pseudonocardia sp.]|uniref:GntR family transcriptional regulator n=1 Tax=Pseudonocardia sp. TaxID=60912 RepID=UPI003D0E65C0